MKGRLGQLDTRPGDNVIATLQCSLVRCSTVQCSAVQFTTVQCSAVQCSAVHCSVVQCSAVQCSTVHYNTPDAGSGGLRCIRYSTPLQYIAYVIHNTALH